jgi:hypothetical protein
MKKILAVLVAALFALVMSFGTMSPAQATTYHWGVTEHHTDCAGNGCLTLYYQIRTDYSVGFKIVTVKIAADDGGVTYQGAAGKGLSCWNDNNNVQWSKTASEASLNDGQTKSWSPGTILPNTSTLTCGWYWTDTFVPGADVNQCAKVKVEHFDDQEGNCG